MKTNKTITATFGLVLIFLCIICRGQNNDVGLKPLSIGDTVPEIIFKQLINYGGEQLKLSDYKGKAVLLDFWATWCIPCLASMPKLESFQDEFHDHLKIILISSDKRSEIERYYSTNAKLQIPTALYSKRDDIARLFPHVALPHYVWINRDGVVSGITDPSILTRNNIQKILSGKADFGTNVKSVHPLFLGHEGESIDSIEIIGQKISKISIDTNAIYSSKVRKYDKRLTQTLFAEFNGRKGFKYIHQINCSIVHLFETAFLGTKSSGIHDYVIVECRDTTIDYPRFYSQNTYRDWEAESSYSYYATYTESIVDSAQIQKKMQADLMGCFPIEAKMQKRKIICLALEKLPNFDIRRLETKGEKATEFSSTYRTELLNQPIIRFFEILRKYGINKTYTYDQPKMPIIDRVGIVNNIDMILGCDITNLDAINRELKKVGLVLLQKEMKRWALVLKDK